MRLCRPIRPVPHSDGCWYKNCVGRRTDINRYGDSKDPHPWRSVFVHNHWATQHENKARFPDDQNTIATLISIDTTPAPANLDRLTTLPAEILVGILRLVLPCQRTFHFSETKSVPGGSMAVHQVCDLQISPKTDQLLRVASVCRQMRSAAYDVFYGTPGQNRFILELSNIPIVSAVSSTHEKLDFASWTRMSCSWFHYDELTFPFSSATLRYVADLTICLSLSSLPMRRQTRNNQVYGLEEVQRKIEALSSCLERKGHSLKRLCISLGITQNHGSQHFHSPYSGSRYYSTALSFGKNDKTGIPTIVTSSLSEYEEFQEESGSSVPVSHYCKTTAEDMRKLASPHMDYITAPLLKIRGLQEVNVEGLFGEAFAEEFRRNALRPFENVRRRDNREVVDLPSRKRRRRI